MTNFWLRTKSSTSGSVAKGLNFGSEAKGLPFGSEAGKMGGVMFHWVRANLTRVTSPPNSNTGCSRLSSLYPSLISFSSFTLPGAPYRIFLLFFPWLPCHFYPVVITATNNNWVKHPIALDL